MKDDHQPIEEPVRGTMQDIAGLLGDIFTPAGYGFMLCCFSFKGDQRMNYISNAKRADMVKALRELADQLENGQQHDEQNGTDAGG